VAAQVAADSPRDTDASGFKQIKAEKKAEKNFGLWENSKMGFGDFVDIIKSPATYSHNRNDLSETSTTTAAFP
jgi:hypothetical protein